MALNISLFSIPLPIFMAVLVLIAAIIVALTVIEMRLSKRAKIKKEYEETYYQQKLAATAALKSDTNGFLISLDKVAREFFSEELGMQSMGKYSQLIEGLEKKQMRREARFCQKMQEMLYSGEKLDPTVLQSLLYEMKGYVLRKEKREVVENKVQVEAAQKVLATNNQNPELNQNILKYVREGKKRGFKLDELKERLVKTGFDEVEVDKVVKFVESELQTPRMPINTEKKILTSFFNPQKKDLEIIKRSVEEKDDVGRAEIIEIVPYKKESLQTDKVEYPEVEPESYKRIGSMDDLERIKKKIDSRKNGVLAG